MSHCLTIDNFNQYSDSSFESYEDFCKYTEENDLFIECFFIDESNIINRIWYIENFITYPMYNISKEFMDMFNFCEIIHQRRNYIEQLKKDNNYKGLFSILDKCFRISYFIELYPYIPEEQFVDVFTLVYSFCEYNFDMLLTDNVLNKLRKLKPNLTKQQLINEGAEITDSIVTIYRGESDKSTDYKEGALSWTLNYDIATFFANRFSAKKPKVYKAQVNIKDIILYIDREEEVLVETKDLIDVKSI